MRKRLQLRDEEGQVLPALLVALFVALAVSTALFVVGRASEQSTRSRTAADAAVLAAASKGSDHLRGWIASDGRAALPHLGDPDWGWDDVSARAVRYAEANGSHLEDLHVVGFDPGARAWTFEATVKAADEVTGPLTGARDIHAESRSRAAVTLHGLCVTGVGFGVHMRGGCVTPDLLDLLCAPPVVPPPAPSPDPSATATPTPTPVPVIDPFPGWLSDHSCPGAGEIKGHLTATVHLVE